MTYLCQSACEMNRTIDTNTGAAFQKTMCLRKEGKKRARRALVVTKLPDLIFEI